MPDITVLLRAADGFDFDSNLRAEAADEIERLREALREIADPDNWRRGEWDAGSHPDDIARAALGEEK